MALRFFVLSLAAWTVASGSGCSGASADDTAPADDAAAHPDASEGTDGGVHDGGRDGASRGKDASPKDGERPTDGADDAMKGVDSGQDSSPRVDACSCVHGICLPTDGCQCDPGWGGMLCDTAVTVLTPGEPVTVTVAQGEWLYYSFYGMATGVTATIMEQTTIGDVWEYLGAETEPTQSSNLAADENTQSATHQVTYSFAGPGMQTWYVGVYGQPALAAPTSCTLELTVIP